MCSDCRLVALYPHLVKLHLAIHNTVPLSLDLPAALRRNDSLRSMSFQSIELIGRVPTMDVTEGGLRWLRTLEKCKAWGGEHTVLLDCILHHLRMNEGRMDNLKHLGLNRSNLGLLA